MIVGNRMHNSDAMPWVRRWVNLWMSRKLSFFCGQHWPDSQCGLRLLHLESWAQCECKAQHFEIESELLVRLAAGGHAIEFLPIEVRYRGERSKIRPIQDTWRWFKWWRGIKREFSTRPRVGRIRQAETPSLPVLSSR